MEPRYWHSRWKQNNIAFHLSEPNPLLIKNFGLLNLAVQDRIFVPLCGKTVDIPWLLSQQIRIVGVELSQVAVEQLFSEMKITPKIVKHDKKTLLYYSENIEIFVANIFDMSQKNLGKVDAIYDRAALVALPEKLRKEYTRHLFQITQNAPQLLITYEYDQSTIEGPPFSIDTAEVLSHYGKLYEIREIYRSSIEGGMKGKCDAQEVLWFLKPKTIEQAHTTPPTNTPLRGT